MQVDGHGSNQVLASRYLVVAVKVTTRIFINQLNATSLVLNQVILIFSFRLIWDWRSSAPACCLFYCKIPL